MLKKRWKTKPPSFKRLLEQNLALNLNTQKALIAIALAIFFLLAMAYF
jgi:hypothetical protein